MLYYILYTFISISVSFFLFPSFWLTPVEVDFYRISPLKCKVLQATLTGAMASGIMLLMFTLIHFTERYLSPFLPELG